MSKPPGTFGPSSSPAATARGATVRRCASTRDARRRRRSPSHTNDASRARPLVDGDDAECTAGFGDGDKVRGSARECRGRAGIGSVFRAARGHIEAAHIDVTPADAGVHLGRRGGGARGGPLVSSHNPSPSSASAASGRAPLSSPPPGEEAGPGESLRGFVAMPCPRRRHPGGSRGPSARVRIDSGFRRNDGEGCALPSRGTTAAPRCASSWGSDIGGDWAVRPSRPGLRPGASGWRTRVCVLGWSPGESPNLAMLRCERCEPRSTQVPQPALHPGPKRPHQVARPPLPDGERTTEPCLTKSGLGAVGEG